MVNQKLDTTTARDNFFTNGICFNISTYTVVTIAKLYGILTHW